MFSCPLDDLTELRLLEERHAEELFALVDSNRDHLRAWLPWVDGSRSAEDTRQFIVGARARLARSAGFASGIWHGGELVGTIGLQETDWPNRATGIGYWIARRFEGRGLVTAACRALLGHAFRELELNRVEIRCAPGNRRSRAIPERLGFREEGTLRQVARLHEGYTDLVVYSMLAEEWRTTLRLVP